MTRLPEAISKKKRLRAGRTRPRDFRANIWMVGQRQVQFIKVEKLKFAGICTHCVRNELQI